MQDQARREARVVLRATEKAGLQEVSLKTPSDDVPQPVIEATPEGVSEAGIGGGVVDVAAADAIVRRAEERVRKGPEAAHGKREARSEQNVVLVGGDTDCAGAGWEVALISVVTAEVGDDAKERNHLAFDRSFEAIHPDTVVAGKADVAVRVSKKDVATGNLRMSERSKRHTENQQNNATTHECILLMRVEDELDAQPPAAICTGVHALTQLGDLSRGERKT